MPDALVRSAVRKSCEERPRDGRGRERSSQIVFVSFLKPRTGCDNENDDGIPINELFYAKIMAVGSQLSRILLLRDIFG